MPDKDAATPDQGTTPDPTQDQAPAPVRDEAADLRQRLAGQTAKVNSLNDQLKAALAASAAAQAALDEAMKTGKLGEEATRSRLETLERELTAAKQEAAVAKLAKEYPETYGVFGDAIVHMSPEALAAAEARFTAGASASTEPPTPMGGNPQRSQTAPKKLEDMSVKELQAHMARVFKPSDIGL